MIRVVAVPFEKHYEANLHAMSHWDPDGGFDTFSVPMYDTNGNVSAYCCSINLDENAVYAGYMMVYASIEEAVEDLGLDLNDGGDED